MRKIAVVGAGYSGLALCYHVKTQFPDFHLDVFYQDIACASSVSTGLLHPLVGKFALKNIDADLGIKETLHLLKVAETALGTQVYDRGGICRVAVSSLQKKVFRRAGKKNEDAHWCDTSKMSFLHHPYLLQKGFTVFSNEYLKGLVTYLKSQGVCFIEKKIVDTSELSEYQSIILACGPGILEFDEGKKLDLELVKGQSLLLEKPKFLQGLDRSLLSRAHVSLCKDPYKMHLGSTYEREFIHSFPDENSLKIIEEVRKFLPDLKTVLVLEKKAGLRVCRKTGYLPLYGHLEKNVWFIGAMGSRGLLYHALAAKRLSTMLGQYLIQEKLLDAKRIKTYS